jgi:hypothetical protein
VGIGKGEHRTSRQAVDPPVAAVLGQADDPSSGNYFWPIWPALLWGIALAIHAWTVYGQRPITDADIDRELGRNHRPDQPAGG